MEFIESLGGTELGRIIVTMLVSMVPVAELRVGIPVGVSLGMNHWFAMLVSVIGNLIPVPFIILFIRAIFDWIKNRIPKFKNFVEHLETKAKKKWAQYRKSKDEDPTPKTDIERKWDKLKKYEAVALFIFVAIPLPGTGAWTGALIAALMDIRMKTALPAILGGVIVAGFLITGLTYGFTLAIS